jgi:hypothetical protein
VTFSAPAIAILNQSFLIESEKYSNSGDSNPKVFSRPRRAGEEGFFPRAMAYNVKV